MNGSVFPNAMCVAVPCSLLSALLKVLIDEGHLVVFQDEDSILRENQAWNGFSFLVGFLIVFRTSQAYNRFWDGCTATHQMRAEWFDSCSSLFAFCNHSKAPLPKIESFKARAVRLFSMLHAAALAELEVLNSKQNGNSKVEIDSLAAYGFEIIDPDGFDRQSLCALKRATTKVELVFSWIQCLIVDSIDSGVLSIPPPILSRAFHEIANGMVAFHDAMKISYIPFPFPYAQTCDCLLCLHWLVVPFVTSQWVSNAWWAFIFVMIQVFILWALNFIAIEIENPFGTDPNDLDGHHMQQEMNGHLLLLLQTTTMTTPILDHSASLLRNVDMQSCRLGSFKTVWASITEEGEDGHFGNLSTRVADFTKGKVHKRKATARGPRNFRLERALTKESALSVPSVANAISDSLGGFASGRPHSAESSTNSRAHIDDKEPGSPTQADSRESHTPGGIDVIVQGLWEAIPENRDQQGGPPRLLANGSPTTVQRVSFRSTGETVPGSPGPGPPRRSASMQSDTSDLSVLPRGPLVQRHFRMDPPRESTI